MITAIFKRELAGYFRTPLAYVILAVFLVLASACCFFLGGFFDSNTASLQPFFRYLPILFLFLVPAVGMRLWAEERRGGTIELLFTLPITPVQAVLGKFLAGWLFLALAVLLTFPLVLTVAYLGSPDWGVIVGSYLGGVLLAGAYLAIASLMSALTKNQVVAFVLGFAVSLGFVLVGFSLFSELLAGWGLPAGFIEWLTNFGFMPHYESITRGLVDLRSVVYFLSLTGFALFLNVVAIERGTGRRSVVVILLVAALVLVNYLAGAAHLRADLTADRTFTLSAGTRGLLAKIEEPIALHFYFSRSLRENPRLAYIKNYADRVEELLRQYVSAAGGKLQLATTDPKPDTPEEEAATRSRITGQALGDGTKLFFGLVATQADQEKAIEFFAPDRESFLEYDLSKLIHSVQLATKPKLGLLTSLPLRAAGFSMPGMPREQGQVVAEEWALNFDIVEIQPTAAELPAGLDALAVIHPQNVAEPLLFAIDQFVLAGKPLFLALDPSSRHFAAQGRQMQMYGGQPQNVSSALPRLLDAWGVTFDAKRIAGDLDLAYLARTQDGTASMPVWIGLRAENLAKDFVPGNSIKDLLLLEAGSFTLNPPAGLEAAPVLQTSTRSGELDAFLLQFGQGTDLSRQLKPDGKARVLAAVLRGTFKTAFPGGAPKPAEAAMPDADGTAPAPKPETPNPKPAASAATPALATSAQPGLVFLIGDTDWLLDESSLDTRYRNAGIVMPFNDNLAFATNVMDFLGGSRDLIGLRGKGTSQRPFEVIRQMELVAQAEYQDRLDELDGRLRSVQQHLSELLQNQKDQTRLVATPEMQTEIEKFRVEEAAMKSERRAIRLSLREGIERLQNTLIALNLLALPALVAIGGIWFFQRRTKRQRA
ncbi:MAG: Gldg family protein [Opitutaceae bacterium]